MDKNQNQYLTKHKNYYQDKVFSGLPNNAILIHPDLKIILNGQLNDAIWLSQILYWYDKGSKQDCIYKSRSEIEVETGLSRDQQIRVERRLKQLGVISIEVRPGRPSLINHIHINFDRLEKLKNSNVRKIRTLDKVSTTLKSVFNGSQHTYTTENISETSQENIHRNKEPPNEGSGYKLALEAKAKLEKKLALKR